MSPIIGIAPCRSLPDYVESVRRAGGEPRVLDPLKDVPEAVVAEIGGLLLTGGVDVDPARYGEEPIPQVVNLEPDRDAFEFALIAAARGAGLPVFGICRGIQVMNVALGGTLVQDIPAQMG
ncbi:MAG: putative glutamine amidotransferase, partial [Acidobacteria bacterium]|nr:putative glutamine amidotransferase [Acidobacteriota bacterium]